jgi:hypothetical protein
MGKQIEQFSKEEVQMANKHKMFGILSHRGNANQNESEIPSYSIRMAIVKKTNKNRWEHGSSAQVVKNLPSKHEVLSSNSSTSKKIKRKPTNAGNNAGGVCVYVCVYRNPYTLLVEM